MSNQIAKTMSPLEEFQHKTVEKLREDIGKFLPEEALAGLVLRATEEQFFKRRKVERNYKTVEEPSWFEEAIAVHCKPLIEKAVAEFVASQQAELHCGIRNFLASHNLMLLALEKLRMNSFQDLEELSSRIAQRVRGGY